MRKFFKRITMYDIRRTIYDIHSTNKGVVFLMALFLIVLISIAMMAFLDIATVDFKLLKNNKYSNEALYVAGAGIEDAISRLRNNRNWQAPLATPLVVEFPSGSGNQYSVTCPQLNPPKIITSTATLSNGYRRRIEVSVQVFGSASLYNVKINYWREI